VRFYKHDPVPAKLRRCVRQAVKRVRLNRFCAQTANFSGPLEGACRLGWLHAISDGKQRVH
jgi:hypothetical protein